VVIADIRQDHLDEAAAYFKEKKIKVHTIKLDITDRKAYAAAADEVEKIYGGRRNYYLIRRGSTPSGRWRHRQPRIMNG